jgi:hypothetical protein
MTRNQRQMSKVLQMVYPWEAITTEREPFILTLRTGLAVQLVIPLGAAVEIEAAGHAIVAGYVTR